VDERAFDSFAAAVGLSATRRAALPVLFSGLLLLHPGNSTARKRRRQHRAGDRRRKHRHDARSERKRKKRCPPCKKRKKGKCKGRLPDGSACPGGICLSGNCCTPTCAGKVCGDDGCGGSCGTCGTGHTCQSGTCVLGCSSGFTDCGGRCVDLQTDARHCGACEQTCNTGQVCVGGACTCDKPACEDAGGCCAGEICVPTEIESDPANCGECGRTCGVGQVCRNADCVSDCPPGLAPCGEACVDLEADQDNCGACGIQCPAQPNATATCNNGLCGSVCNAGFHDCGGNCVRDDDPLHCGTRCTPCPDSPCSHATCDGTNCGRTPTPGCCEVDADCGDNNACTTDRCGADHTCWHSTIVCTSNDPCQDPICDPLSGCTTVDHCQSDQVCIAEGGGAWCCPQSKPFLNGTQCAECTSTDLTHCAAPPPNTEVTCSAEGNCRFTCLAGWGDCGLDAAGCETNLLTDPAHCGSCWLECADGQTCTDGVCGVVCGSDFCAVTSGNPDCCGTHCTNVQTDDANCGSCGQICAAGEQCGTADCCDGLQPTDDLEAAIAAAEPGATLLLCAGTWEITRTIRIDKDLTVIGAGPGQTILDGGEAVRVLMVTRLTSPRPKVTIRGLTVTKGTTGDRGGGILNRGSLLLSDVEVSNNSATNASDPMTSGGGGIWNIGSLTLVRTTVTGNRADRAGGGILNGGNGIWVQLTLEAGTSVSGNTAVFGGGIANGEALTLKAGSSVSGNTALPNVPNSAYLGYGGGIHNSGGICQDGRICSYAPVTLEAGSSVSGNTAGVGGGVLNNPGGLITLEVDDIVTANYLADGMTVNNCEPMNTIPNCVG
jgi:hypothetical protein